MEETEDKSKKETRKWRCIAALFIVLCIILICLCIGIIISKNREMESTKRPTCGGNFEKKIDTSEPQSPGIFHDITSAEIEAINNYLKGVPEINLETKTFQLNSSFIFGIDLMLPTKTSALEYLDSGGRAPTRKAKVIMNRGDLNPPVIAEYEVGPLPSPSYYNLISYRNRRNPVEFAYRPFDGAEFGAIFGWLFVELDNKIGHILKESYGTKFLDCQDICLRFCPNLVSSAVTKKKERYMWFHTYYMVEFYTLHPIDLLIYVKVDGTNSSNFSIEKLVYGGQYRNALEELVTDYESGSLKKSNYSLPVHDTNLYSTLHKRGPHPIPEKDQRPPRLVEPDGPRYKIHHREIEYMNWKFHLRMSLFKGPQLHDVKFQEERIAYEVGLQEIAVFYYADAPTLRMANYVDSVGIFGKKARALIPGVDCPETATYLPTFFSKDDSKGFVKNERSFCVFELNSGYPLRRHMEYLKFRGGFYGGLVDNCLIVRTMMSLNNYDYILDYIFHQSGILEAKIISTGYVYASSYSSEEKGYGFQIADNTLGTIHHHLFHFKADLDVLGRENRYETLDLKTVNVSNSKWLNALDTMQTVIKFTRNLKSTEQEAAYKYNFDTPKDHIFFNNLQKNKYGDPRSYKVQLFGMSKQLLPEDMLNEKSISWARYQMAVTKHKDEEDCSSSIYATFDSLNPVIEFNKFLEDNQNIVDEDLVLWASLGLFHIPHTEDLPLTQTVGKHLSLLISPYNYHQQDPSVSSKDQVRVQHKKGTDSELEIIRYFDAPSAQCVSKESQWEEDAIDHPEHLLEP